MKSKILKVKFVSTKLFYSYYGVLHLQSCPAGDALLSEKGTY